MRKKRAQQAARGCYFDRGWARSQTSAGCLNSHVSKGWACTCATHGYSIAHYFVRWRTSRHAERAQHNGSLESYQRHP